MDDEELNLNIRTPSQILAMKFPATDKYLPNGIFAKGQPLGIVGPAGIGKSRLLLQLAACVTTGRSFLGWRIKKRDVKWLIVQTENGSARLQTDLKAMRAWLGKQAFKEMDRNIRMHVLIKNDDGFLSLEDGNNALRINGSMVDHKPDVVVFDPLVAFSAGNLNSDAGMLQTCRGLQRLATRHNPDASVVILHHSLAGRAGMKKAIGYDAGGYAKGSKAFVQWVRGQLNIAPASETDNTRLVVSCGKNSNGPWFEPFGAVLDPDTMVYEVDKSFDLATWQANLTTPSPAPNNDRPTPESIALLVKPMPLAGPAFAKIIMEEWGVSQPTAYRQILAARGKTIKRNASREYAAL